MAGSDHSGQDMEAGRTNRAEDKTQIWAQYQEDEERDFDGDAILVVDVTRAGPPRHTINGIEATGWSAAGIGGVGVVGKGGGNQGTGVFGWGAAATAAGVGGIGVHGIGGSQLESALNKTDPPGAGIVGQGGRQTDSRNTLRLPHGAGVIGIAGGSGKQLPPLADVGSVGVYAQGAEAEVRTVDIESVPTVVGPIDPGPGVLGRGGVPIPRGENRVAAGVIGLAGDTAIPPISETGNSGVYGGGPVGVFGHGFVSGVRGNSEQGRGVAGETDSGVGVFGSASKDTGRGGAFQTARSAQVWLVPKNEPTEFPAPVAVSPTAIRESQAPRLPRDGRGGDLMALADNQGQCTLWFCVKGERGAGPARWAQVLLGPSFDGQL
jgi:hypothetical protein